MHPAAQDDIPYVRIAVYVLYHRARVQLWRWPETLRRRVFLAAMMAMGAADRDLGGREVERAALAEAWKVIQEASRSRDDARRKKGA